MYVTVGLVVWKPKLEKEVERERERKGGRGWNVNVSS